MAKILFTDIHEILTMQGVLARKCRGPQREIELGLAKKQAMVVDDGRIVWLGSQNKIPKEHLKIKKQVAVKANVFPGFIDCHTHSIFAGDRTHEFEMRVQGASYQEIAQKGGGILHTVRETRSATTAQLKKSLELRLQNFLAQGVTTVEVKTGYGLTAKDEIRLLKVIQQAETPVRKEATFLGAHAIPPECASAEEYLAQLLPVLSDIARQKLCRRVDIFIEKNYFSLEDSKKFLHSAKKLGFDVTIHADQLSRTGATDLAFALEAKSADHVICIDKKDIAKAAKADTTCVFLPTADFYLRCAYPPARDLIDGGARYALATDFNPGTSPTQNIQWVGLLARQEMKMTLPEVFAALTVGGSYALGLEKSRGVLAPGFVADFFITEKSWDQFFYDLLPIPMDSVWIDGRVYQV